MVTKHKTVAERAEIERRAVLALREMASEVLRTVAGGGARPYNIPNLMADALDAVVAYADCVDYGVDSQWMRRALDPEESYGEPEDTSYVATRIAEIVREDAAMQAARDHHLDLRDAENTIRIGALRIAASKLVGQTTQVELARNKLHEGLRELEKVRAARRASDA